MRVPQCAPRSNERITALLTFANTHTLNHPKKHKKTTKLSLIRLL